MENPYIPHVPAISPETGRSPQAAFLMTSDKEVMYGGAAGPGKSDALLMAALMYVTVPGYNALLLRRTFPMLTQAKSLIPRAHEWLGGTDAKWVEQSKTWTFPSGATLAFGHIQYENDKYNFQSGEYQFIGFDELTQFSDSQYLYLMSRLRRLKVSGVPIRIRAASNPGGIGHEWVKARFIDGGPGRFIRGRLADNPYLDTEEYAETLSHLDPVTRQQLLDGDWSVRADAAMMRREWFGIVDASPAEGKRCRYWDLAATAAKETTDPDYTVGGLCSWHEGVLYIEDIRRVRLEPGGVERLVLQTAQVDGTAIPIWMEQEPGASGKTLVDHYQRRVLAGYAFGADKVTGPKPVRAAPLASMAEAGNVKLVRAPWNQAFLDEAELFPYGSHDDQVDAVSGAYAKLAIRPAFAFAV